MDEADGRKAALRVGLRVTGVLGILLRAKQDGETALLKPKIESSRTNAGFFIGGRWEQDVLRAAGE